MTKHVFFLFVLLCFSVSCRADKLIFDRVKIRSEGVTNITGNFEDKRILIAIVSSEIYLGKMSDEIPKRRLTNCTYSRYPCSQINNLSITVNGKELLIPRSVFADLTDVNVASLHEDGGGFY